MTTRNDGNTTYTQNFNVENELESVVVSSQTTSFTYDASGLRVKTIQPNGSITDTPFPGYEVENPGSSQTVRITFTIAGQAVALRVIGSSSNTYYHLYNDHLGSLAAIGNSSGGLVSGSRATYQPFGSYRGTTPTQTLTDRHYTSQKENLELGLYYYNARYYAPGLGRFISADTIVPNPANPQSFNRYSYIRSNPINGIDPTGHAECGSPWEPACQRPDNPYNVRIFYINGLVLKAFQTLPANPTGNEYASTLAALESTFGADNVEAIPVFNEGYSNINQARLDMVGEAYGVEKPYANRVANVIELSLSSEYGHPLAPGERLILVGSSAGGTVAIEALDILEDGGIFVDQVILRGSFVGESWLNNVGQIDYLAADPPTADWRNYSVDWNPLDEVSVQEHIVSGFSYHSPGDAPDQAQRQGYQQQINSLIVDLIAD